MKKTGIELQQEKVKHLLKLIEENPDLEILPMIDTEIVCSEDYGYWAGGWGKADIDEYWVKDERIYFRSHDEDSLIENVACDDIDEDLDDKEAIKKAKKIVNGYDWQKAIIVRIETL